MCLVLRGLGIRLVHVTIVLLICSSVIIFSMRTLIWRGSGYLEMNWESVQVLETNEGIILRRDHVFLFLHTLILGSVLLMSMDPYFRLYLHKLVCLTMDTLTIFCFETL